MEQQQQQQQQQQQEGGGHHSHHSHHSHHHHGHSHGHDHHGHDHHGQPCAGHGPVETDPRERQHLQEVVLSFLEYNQYMGAEVERRWQHLCKLPPRLAATLPPESLGPALQRQRAAVAANQDFLVEVVQGVDEIAPSGGELLDATWASLERRPPGSKPLTSAANMAKIKATLHSCFREWSAAGAAERAASFGPLLAELEQRLPVTPDNRNRQRVLVPGSGLGRLPLEIAARGYACQGNEFSYHMLLTSNFLLNNTEAAGAFAVYPFIDQSCNLWRAEDATREAAIPDVCPGELLGLADAAPAPDTGPGPSTTTGPQSSPPAPVDFSMVAGDFLEVYGGGGQRQEGAWDAVVTCFFLDTAPVVMEYVELIHRLLRPGGFWINLGPLLYHWAGGGAGTDVGGDERYGRSVELAWEEVRHVMVAGFGFELLREEPRPGVRYAANPGGMMATVYDCVLFAARKPPTQQHPPPPQPQPEPKPEPEPEEEVAGAEG